MIALVTLAEEETDDTEAAPAVAIEPVSCAVNAFNTGDGLRWLAPGESWSASWGLRPVGF